MATRQERTLLKRTCKKQVRGGNKMKDEDIVKDVGEGSRYLQQEFKVDTQLWSGLPSLLAYRVLSFLPKHMLIETLNIVNPNWDKKPWLHIYTFPHDFFGHGKNLLSTYGFAIEIGKRKMLAFEHESATWIEFPLQLPSELTSTDIMSGSLDGLVLRKKYKSTFSKLSNVKVGVWNPLFGVIKWLPNHPQHTQESWDELFTLQCYLHVMVDEESRTYKVMIFHKLENEVKPWVYAIYNSRTRSWSDLESTGFFDYPYITTTSSRYVCIRGASIPHPTDHPNDYISCYDDHHGCWMTTFMSNMLMALGRGRKPRKLLKAEIRCFVILNHRLYMVILFLSNPDMEEDEVEVTRGRNWRANSVSEYVLASLDLLSFTPGHTITPTLRLELVVSSTPSMPGRRSNDYYWPLCDMYTYMMMQGKEFIAF
jgi:hypothetical protein